MTAHRALKDVYDASHVQLDPGANETIYVTEDLKVSEIKTDAAEAITLDRPIKAGISHTVMLKEDGGDLTLTVTGGYDSAGNTGLTFNDAGDWAKFESIDVGGTLRWQVVAADGVNAAIGDTTATPAEVSRVADASARIVTTTATILSLTVTEHAERILLVNTDSTVANTFTLPASAGTGETFTIINNLVQTQGTVVVAAAGTDVMQGFCVAIDSTAGGGSDTFATTATSDKVTLNLTTTGGLGGDKIVARDLSAGTWHVEVQIAGSGTLATPFSAT